MTKLPATPDAQRETAPLALPPCSDIKHWQRVGLLARLVTNGRFSDISKSDAAYAYAHGKDVFIRAGARAAWRVFKNTLIHDAKNVVFCICPNVQVSHTEDGAKHAK